VRWAARWWGVVGLVTAGAGCSTVDPGSSLALAPVVFDEGYFYCQIQPNVLESKSCGSGDSSQGDAAGGCHSRVTQFVLQTPVPAIHCNGNVPVDSPPPAAVQNYQTATEEMTLDIENAPLLAWPTKKIASHPRQIFAPESPEADLIRQWATKYSSH
jgi:hypothetical protein